MKRKGDISKLSKIKKYIDLKKKLIEVKNVSKF